ncbi:uncharacterized protein LOC135688833 [Rhopilema esculentum]|uniref:uncharacterized protein LOC135688833 n=1 Tax=Rhopilema esculentum TaxID=499914 RepID=UPI0031E257B2
MIEPNERSTKVEQRNYLHSLASEMVDKFILRTEKVEQVLIKVEAENEHEKQKAKHFQCRISGCGKAFKHDGKARREHKATHGMTHSVQPSKCSGAIYENRDDMLNYQLVLLEFGMLVQNFFDAIIEGDGERIVRCWEFFLPYLRCDGQGSTHYALEAFYLLCRVNALLTPKAAHELKWNRFFKNKNGPGGKIPLNLSLEHHNKLIETLMQSLGPSGTNQHCLNRYIKAIRVNKDVLDRFDQQIFFKKGSREHKDRCEKADLYKNVNELVENYALTHMNGRKYMDLCNVNDSILDGVDMHAMFTRIKEHKKKFLQKSVQDNHIIFIKQKNMLCNSYLFWFT